MLKSIVTRKRAKQVEFNLLKGRRGGPGRGQGRKPGRSGRVPHTRRPFVDKNHPVHVSTRVMQGMPSLRGAKLWAAVRQGFVHGCQKDHFRIVHFSVQGMHIHFICEAKNRRQLSRGVQAFKVRVARAVNRACARTGSVFADRYHERIIKNPTQCRHAIAYVLNNQRHHAHEEGATYAKGRVDPCSSASSFTGWTIDRPRLWAPPPCTTDTDDEPAAVKPEGWLLRIGWRRGAGPISPNAIPGLPKGAPRLAR